jgi:molybdopterin synthase catalytic subunit
MSAQFKISVQAEDFDVGIETKALAVSGTGGVNTFLGVVRNQNEDADVRCLHLEHYPGMTEKQIELILSEAADKWTVLAATVIHRVGDLYPGDQIVFVGVASPHRAEAFDACEFIIDYLKTRATFWKKEFTPDDSRWLSTRQSDVEAAAAWKVNEASEH